jgi:glutamate--cysteine ligase
VRCVDVSPFSPVGLDEQQIRFMDTFLLYCLLEESPPCNDAEQDIQADNLEAVVNRGRQPGLLLNNCAGEVPLDQWADGLLSDMEPLAALLDTAFDSADYSNSLHEQVAKVADPELTPSARILREMREKDLPFFRLALSYSERWGDYFRNRPLPTDIQAAFEQETRRSLDAQAEIERADDVSFEQYLDNFFSQYRAL